ncbi:hypothetical protein [Streptomyces sp. NBC_00199]|uniref:hypothetical protein n=1 Tax=Streptomyces sp. NBC_00199 TaxID=2975678 RepID=UPI00225C3333|nr:hypothetical protein [Streptomyces sp. NBC_00199]MCX5266078.1 hypothetical protein [Streptomyces sp. NBC_00199]
MHEWLNTASTFFTALIAIPALILALITYQDQKASEDEDARKEASYITWYWMLGSGPDGDPTALIVENRSLRPVYTAVLNIEEDSKENRQVYFIDDTVSPCTRVNYSLGDHGADVMVDLNAEMFFADSLGHLWRTDYEGTLHDLGERNLNWSRGLDMIEEWGLSPKYEDLQACG